MEEYKENIVVVKLADNSESELAINIMEDDPFTISVSLDDRLYEVQEEDILPAFQKLRDMLLLNGIGLKCCGAMIDAHQLEVMNTSDKVYTLTLGKPALRKDIPMIFNYTDIREFPNTSEQKEFAPSLCRKKYNEKSDP